MGKFVLGIDVGGTNLRGGLVSSCGEIFSRKKEPSGASLGIEVVMENLVRFILSYSSHKVDAIAIGIPGIVDIKQGILTQAPNIRGVSNYPVVKELRSKLSEGVPIIIENDANCATMGEFWMGAGRGVGSMMMLTIGTGLGGGILLNGRLWRGEDGMAAEAGHIVLFPDGPPCSCGNYGCLEVYVSAKGLKRLVDKEDRLLSVLHEVTDEQIPYVLSEMASDGNTLALNIWKRMGKYLGIGLTTFVNLLNVEMIVLGGGVSNAWDFFIGEALSELKRRGLKVPVERVKIEKGVLGDDAGILGAAFLAFNRS